MKITVDTEKDSRDGIKAVIRLLQKIIGEEAAAEAETVKVKDTEPEYASSEQAEELLSLIAEKNKPGKGSDGAEEEEDLPGVPKSVKEAYELAEDLETY